MIHTIRFLFYCILFAFSAMTMALCALRLHYTTHITAYHPANDEKNFYDPIVAELLATSAFTLLWAPWVARTIYSKINHHFFNTFGAEILALFVFFVLWVVGASIIATYTISTGTEVYSGSLSSCWNDWQCRTLIIFAWLSGLVVFILFTTSLVFAIKNDALGDYMHGYSERPTPIPEPVVSDDNPSRFWSWVTLLVGIILTTFILSRRVSYRNFFRSVREPTRTTET